MVELWGNTEIEPRFLVMLDELKEQEALNDHGMTPKEKSEADEQRATFDAMCVEKEAQAAVWAIEKALKTFVHKRISFDEEIKDEAVRNFAPLLMKYGVLLPAWLAQYQEEIIALKSAGELAMNAVSQVKQYKHEDMLALKQEQEAA